ncbi:hypothetical protein SDC9_192997 [bioreactor metagenome]|uniref:Uncharacterized protein n=1 Tax=bioreactor metagenome TaxID=1076179 RepID=A0A645I2P5_9ZZZZ
MPGYAFSRQCRCVERSRTGNHDAVQRDPFTGFHLDRIPYPDLFRENGLDTILRDHGCFLGTYIEQCADISPGTADSRILEEFTDGIKQHHRHTFGILTDKESADGGNAHQGEFVEDILLPHGFPCLLQHGDTYRKIGNKIPSQPDPLILEERNSHSGQDDTCHQ